MARTIPWLLSLSLALPLLAGCDEDSPPGAEPGTEDPGDLTPSDLNCIRSGGCDPTRLSPGLGLNWIPCATTYPRHSCRLHGLFKDELSAPTAMQASPPVQKRDGPPRESGSSRPRCVRCD